MPEYDLKVRRRIYRAEFGAYLLIITAALTGFWRIEQQQDEIVHTQVLACQSANDSKAGQRRVWTFFFDVVKANAVAQDEPPAVLRFYDAYLKWITDEVLRDRDCSDLDKVYPNPLPPPSFKKALREAKKHEEAQQRRREGRR